MNKQYVSYIRVSTKDQNYGMDAQRLAVTAYIDQIGGTLHTEFSEKESGGKNDRPELIKAINKVKDLDAVLIIAKLDRLSRSASFLLQLRDSDVPFVCADMPDANNLTVGIMAVVAEEERRMISKRTKAGLKAARKSGVKLGRPKGIPMPEEWGKAQNEGRKAKYRAKHAKVLPIIKTQRQGGMTYRTISDFLNTIGLNDQEYNPMKVRRLYRNYCDKTN